MVWTQCLCILKNASRVFQYSNCQCRALYSVQFPQLPPQRPEEPPPALAGLFALPPPPPAHHHIVPSHPAHILPPLTTRYTLTAFCDDLKPAVTSIYEFRLVERVMKIFELSSGCKMHRSKESEKCKCLPLSVWRKNTAARRYSFRLFHLVRTSWFLGVTLKATCAATRTVNGIFYRKGWEKLWAHGGGL